MNFLSKLSIFPTKLFWSLRKVRLPIKRGYRVLEVGSGGNPHPASDVLLEKYLDNSHRLKSIHIDRTTVLADACKMPFKDGAFDYVIAFHVLEHVEEPEQFLGELMRVSKAGYIETPNAMYERVNPFDVHLLEVAERQGKLLIYRKSASIHDEYLSGVNWIQEQPIWRNFFNRHPRAFHVCYEWRDRIDFEVVNPAQSLAWFKSPPAGLATSTVGLGSTSAGPKDFRSALIWLIRKYYLLRKTEKVELAKIIACPACKGELVSDTLKYHCISCKKTYRKQPVPDFTTPDDGLL